MQLSESPLANRWLWRIVTAGVIIIPLYISTGGKDGFRLPKEILFRLETLLLAGICIVLLAARKIPRPASWKDPDLLLPALAVAWSLVSFIGSSNRVVSLPSFLWICGWALIFIVTTALANGRPLAVVYVSLLPALINGFLVLLQEADLWNPLFSGKTLEHAYHSALIGNANDVGVFLVGPAIASFALIFVTRSHRVLHVSAAFLLLVAAVANHTLTALIALVAGFLATVFLISKPRAIAAALIACVILIATVWLYPPLRFRYDLNKRFIATGYYDGFLSGRLLPNITAAQMFADHVLTGVGPGCFKWEFFWYKVRVVEQHKNMVLSGQKVNYGEAHNDHLQILAETGLPGYAIFVACLVGISSISFRRIETPAPEQKFAKLASFPLALSFAVLAIAQFPLELASSMAVNIYLFALCRAWRQNG